MTNGPQSTDHSDLDFLPAALERIPEYDGFFYGKQSEPLKTILFNAVASFLQNSVYESFHHHCNAYCNAFVLRTPIRRPGLYRGENRAASSGCCSSSPGQPRSRLCVGRRLLVSRWPPLQMAPGLLDSRAIFGCAVGSPAIHRRPVLRRLLGGKPRTNRAQPPLGSPPRAGLPVGQGAPQIRILSIQNDRQTLKRVM